MRPHYFAFCVEYINKPTLRRRKLQSTKMKVTIKETSMVRPSQDTPSGRIWLSNLDLMYAPFYAIAAYVYESDGSANFFDAKLLKDSLSKVLVTFYPLAGRLALDENGRREIDCNGEGVVFVEAEADCPMGDYIVFAANKFELLPAVDFTTHFSNPLILLQATKFSCGGVLLSIRAHHNAVDGGGGTHFVNAWSEVARGQPITLQPVFDRTFLRARDPPNPNFHHAEYNPPFFTSHIEDGPESFEYLIKIPMNLINVLKSKVNNEDVKYSTFEVLTAHLWHCTSKARNFDSDQAATLIFPFDGRYKLNADFPKGYSGNVIFYAKIVVTTRELLSEPLIKTVERIHKAIKQMSDDYMRSAIDYLENNIDSDKLMKYQGAQQLQQGFFFVNSWLKLPIFDANFGWGTPITMLPLKLLEGMANYPPWFNGENELSIFICLQEEHKKSFESLLYVLE